MLHLGRKAHTRLTEPRGERPADKRPRAPAQLRHADDETGDPLRGHARVGRAPHPQRSAQADHRLVVLELQDVYVVVEQPPVVAKVAEECEHVLGRGGNERDGLDLAGSFAHARNVTLAR
jgi:hypothetical protein